MWCSVEEGVFEVFEKNFEKFEVVENGVFFEVVVVFVEEFGGWLEVVFDELEFEGSWKVGVFMDFILYFLKIDLVF